MTEDVYRDLARKLDAIPNGFPATESGVELRLLAAMYTAEEAALAAALRSTHEPPAEIAARMGLERAETRRRLKDMARKGLINASRGQRGLVYGLRPFVVGVYEAQLPRLDEAMARLFEEYYQEVRGGIAYDRPSVHRVIPVGEAVRFELEVHPYERAVELIEGARAWGVRDCICRVQQRLVGKGCDRPIENCLVFAPVEGAFDRSSVDRALSKEEALRILRETEEAGLVHTTGNYRDGNSYICNCCACCCGVLRGVAEFGNPNAIARSDFQAIVDADLCVGCGSCLERCQFGALSMPEYLCDVDQMRCVGCGLCATACPTEALHLERRPVEEREQTPATHQGWLRERAQARGMSAPDIA
jgi:Fe-S-cluster-containing hydrogenase component 2